jgi:xanthine/CO dehydrogenase XdhC/CoxF family maturation factor
MREIQAIVRHLTGAGARERCVLATLVSVEGSSYRRPGARLLITPRGARIGSISGGCLEEDVIARARRVARTGKAELVTYDTTSENDLVWGVGLGCHGVVGVLIEPLPARPAWAKAMERNFKAGRPTRVEVVWSRSGVGGRTRASRLGKRSSGRGFCQVVEAPRRLFVFGAGDDARPLVRMAAALGWRVTVADPRPAYGTRKRFPDAEAAIVAPADKLVGLAKPGPDAVAVVMTHHFMHDVPLLRGLLARPLAYVGLLGPKARANRILDQLAHQGMGMTAAWRERLHAPIGLDLGADGPDEVALSILAEICAVLSGRDARPLRERTLPIHDQPAAIPIS